MIARLKDRQKQIPNGFKFYQPETGWKAPRMVSFQVLVNQIIAHRRGNPALVAKHGWSLDHAAVEEELDAFNARVCLSMGWDAYVMTAGEGDAVPKTRPPSQLDVEQVSVAAGRAKKIWSGIRTLNDWIDSGEAPVPAAMSAQRAQVCAACPKNTAGDFTSWFTKPAALAIQRQIEKLSARKLATPQDASLNVCDVCLCPLKLKVHTPLKFIHAQMNDAVLKDLAQVGGCWIVAELQAAG